MEHDGQLTPPIVIGPNQNVEQGVQPVQPAFFSKLDNTRWDDVWCFSAVAQTSSFRNAAGILKCSVNTVRSRIFRLEEVLQTELLHRTNHGISLTQDGRSLLKWAERLRKLAGSTSEIVPDADVTPDGELTIGCSEGLATFCLLPEIKTLRAQLPRCAINIVTDTDQARVHDRRNDLSVGFERPTQLDLVTARLATAHFMLFCSNDYAQQFGVPHSIDELETHCYVEQSSLRLGGDLARAIFGPALAKKVTRLRVDSSFGLFWAISNNLGIGALPTYAASLSQRLVPIELPVRLRFDVWLSYDPRNKDRTINRTALAWLRSCFDCNSQPWFAEQFHHPESFTRLGAETQSLAPLDQLVEER